MPAASFSSFLFSRGPSALLRQLVGNDNGGDTAHETKKKIAVLTELLWGELRIWLGLADLSRIPRAGTPHFAQLHSGNCVKKEPPQKNRARNK